MANVPGKAPFADRKSSSGLSFEEFVPPSAWTEDSTCHYLLVDLPGFKREELKLQLDDQTHIIVSGERQVKNNKYKRFEQRFELPKNADTGKITGKLDGEILYISVPKQVKEEQHGEKKNEGIHGGEMEKLNEAPRPNVDDNSDKYHKDKDEADSQRYNDEGPERKRDEGDIHEAKGEDWGKEADLLLRIAIEKLRKNKGIVVAAIFAFSLGVLVCQKFPSNGK